MTIPLRHDGTVESAMACIGRMPRGSRERADAFDALWWDTAQAYLQALFAGANGEIIRRAAAVFMDVNLARRHG